MCNIYVIHNSLEIDPSIKSESTTPVESSRKGEAFVQQSPTSTEKVSPTSGLWDTPSSTSVVNGREGELVIFAATDDGNPNRAPADSLKPVKRGPGRPPRRS